MMLNTVCVFSYGHFLDETPIPHTLALVLKSLLDSLTAEADVTWSEESVKQLLQAEEKKSGLKQKTFMTVLRLALTGSRVSYCFM